MRNFRLLKPVLLVGGACVVAGVVMYVALRLLAPPPAVAVKPSTPREVKASRGPVSAKAALSPGEELVESVEPTQPESYVHILSEASVSPESGPLAQLQVVGFVKDCPDGAVKTHNRKAQTSGWREEVHLRTNQAWCVAVLPGSNLPVVRSLPGQWADDATVVEADSINQYLAFTDPKGKRQAIRAAALSYCPDEESLCTGAVVLELSVDDQNVLLPVRLSDGTSLLQLK